MSKKVRFYLVLNIIGIALTLFVRMLLYNAARVIPEALVQTGAVILINVASGAVCLFIVFFFLLYWWSDRKWTNIKQRFKKKR